MWIYYYASFGPGHQSGDDGFKHFHDSYDMETIQEFLLNHIESCGYDIDLEFWKVDHPPAKYVNNKITSLKNRITGLQEHLNMLKSQSGFVAEEEDGEDATIKKNMSGCIESDLLKRLHKACIMYSADDLSNWRWGKKRPIGPNRNKILRIMRISEHYPSYEKKKKRKLKNKIQLDDILTSDEQSVLFYFEDNPDRYISPTEIGRKVGGGVRHSSWGSPKCLKLVKCGFLKRNEKGWYIYNV